MTIPVGLTVTVTLAVTLTLTLTLTGVPEMGGHASWVHAYYPPGSRVGEVPLYAWFLQHALGG